MLKRINGKTPKLKTFVAYEKDGRGFRYRGKAMLLKHLKSVMKTSGDNIKKLVDLQEQRDKLELTVNVQSDAVKFGFLPLTRREQNDGHTLVQCLKCGWWGSSRLKLDYKGGTCPCCYRSAIAPFDLDKEIARLQTMKMSAI